MLQGFFVPFFTILIAEMLDKSQLAMVALSAKTRNRLMLFLGGMLAFIFVDGLAIILGATVSELLPKNLTTLIAGFIFVIFGIFSLKAKDEAEEKTVSKKGAFASAFLIIFFSEWADKTQLAAAAFASYLNPLSVFLGTISALAIVTLLAIFLGTKITKYVEKDLLRKITGIIFLLIGAFFLYSVL